ncbi:hypothetical protein [Flavobacterium sp. HJJ]|uniref:hypothetical protein n=1 Tax=Flavobacterium sp. HJJ TaxID=2783792 RepID=UPI001889F965|nr:hypothetical protein [Flavobacterium sp. HJJ]MBF4470901.1 hypothetical protein [Flavobacterium sp. HJJ]
MKKIILCILLVASMNTKAQTVRGFGGFSAYLGSILDRSIFVGVNCGTEFTIKRFIKPEIEFNFLYVPIDDVELRSDQGNTISIFKRSANSLNFNFCPKICLGNNGQNDTYLVILPKYSFSKVAAVGEFTTINHNDVKTTSKETIVDWQHSLGIGLGLDISVSTDNTDSLCLNIYYQNVDIGTALNELNHSGSSRFFIKNSLGAGLNYYFSFKKKTRPKPVKIPEPLK